MQLPLTGNGPRIYSHNLQASKRFVLCGMAASSSVLSRRRLEPGSPVYLLIIASIVHDC